MSSSEQKQLLEEALWADDADVEIFEGEGGALRIEEVKGGEELLLDDANEVTEIDQLLRDPAYDHDRACLSFKLAYPPLGHKGLFIDIKFVQAALYPDHHEVVATCTPSSVNTKTKSILDDCASLRERSVSSIVNFLVEEIALNESSYEPLKSETRKLADKLFGEVGGRKEFNSDFEALLRLGSGVCDGAVSGLVEVDPDNGQEPRIISLLLDVPLFRPDKVEVRFYFKKLGRYPLQHLVFCDVNKLLFDTKEKKEWFEIGRKVCSTEIGNHVESGGGSLLGLIELLHRRLVLLKSSVYEAEYNGSPPPEVAPPPPKIAPPPPKVAPPPPKVAPPPPKIAPPPPKVAPPPPKIAPPPPKIAPPPPPPQSLLLRAVNVDNSDNSRLRIQGLASPASLKKFKRPHPTSNPTEDDLREEKEIMEERDPPPEFSDKDREDVLARIEERIKELEDEVKKLAKDGGATAKLAEEVRKLVLEDEKSFGEGKISFAGEDEFELGYVPKEFEAHISYFKKYTDPSVSKYCDSNTLNLYKALRLSKLVQKTCELAKADKTLQQAFIKKFDNPDLTLEKAGFPRLALNATDRCNYGREGPPSERVGGNEFLKWINILYVGGTVAEKGFLDRDYVAAEGQLYGRRPLNAHMFFGNPLLPRTPGASDIASVGSFKLLAFDNYVFRNKAQTAHARLVEGKNADAFGAIHHAALLEPLYAKAHPREHLGKNYNSVIQAGANESWPGSNDFGLGRGRDHLAADGNRVKAGRAYLAKEGPAERKKSRTAAILNSYMSTAGLCRGIYTGSTNNNTRVTGAQRYVSVLPVAGLWESSQAFITLMTTLEVFRIRPPIQFVAVSLLGETRLIGTTRQERFVRQANATDASFTFTEQFSKSARSTLKSSQELVVKAFSDTSFSSKWLPKGTCFSLPILSPAPPPAAAVATSSTTATKINTLVAHLNISIKNDASSTTKHRFVLRFRPVPGLVIPENFPQAKDRYSDTVFVHATTTMFKPDTHWDLRIELEKPWKFVCRQKDAAKKGWDDEEDEEDEEDDAIQLKPFVYGGKLDEMIGPAAVNPRERLQAHVDAEKRRLAKLAKKK